MASVYPHGQGFNIYDSTGSDGVQRAKEVGGEREGDEERQTDTDRERGEREREREHAHVVPRLS